jgi:hypothetical protein
MTKWILVCALVLLSVGTVFGQTQSWYFGGARFDYKPNLTTKVMGGVAIDLGKGFIIVPQADIGDYDSLTRTGTLSSDIAKSLWTSKFGTIFILLAPSFDWVNVGDGDFAGYVNAAVGGFAVVPSSLFIPPKGELLTLLNQNLSFYIGGRLKTDLSQSQNYPKGGQFGVGVIWKR